MIPRSPRSKRSTALIGMLLAVSLLFSQWLGYGHAIAHAGVAAEPLKAAQAYAGVADHAKSAGTCAALDAAALGAGLQGAGLPPLPAMAADGPVTLPLRSGWHRLFTAHFSSRAPPRLNA